MISGPPLPENHCVFIGEPGYPGAQKARICTLTGTSCFTYSDLKTVQNCVTCKNKIKELTVKTNTGNCKNRVLKQDELGNTFHGCQKFGNICSPDSKLNLQECEIEIQLTQKGQVI
jgi:hypothetical protein